MEQMNPKFSFLNDNQQELHKKTFANNYGQRICLGRSKLFGSIRKPEIKEEEKVDFYFGFNEREKLSKHKKPHHYV